MHGNRCTNGPLMPNEQRSDYQGHAITTRWEELHVALDARARRFRASFRVARSGAGRTSWQQFPAGVFDTPENAAANALNVAKHSIDRGQEEMAK